ncbi:Arsenical pump membrane protein [Stanieria sp. NIES-3757]|nr:Arsenical pump membrane protein [Stanieria sp. NIES-3757]
MIDFLQPLRYLLLAITYLGLALGNLPGLRMNRSTIALVGSALLMLLQVIDLETAWQAIDANTILFLMSMMIVNAYLAYSGFFNLALVYLTHFARSPFGLLIVLTFSSGILSAFFLNDTIALVFTPLVLDLTKGFQLNPIPYLLALAAATNLGSVATISGNPQNMLIGSFAEISYLDFARFLTPIALISLIIQIGLICLFYPEVRSHQTLKPIKSIRPKILPGLLKKTVLITVGLLLAFACGFPLGESALVAAALLLITRRIKAERILKQVDWNLLVLFSGLFVLTKAVQNLDLLAIFNPFTTTNWGLLGTVALLSNLISNVPAVLLMQPLLEHFDTHAWLLLAAGSTLAGNLTLFGSVANLIVAEAANQLGYKLTFSEHLRLGIPLTIITLIISYVYLEIFLI